MADFSADDVARALEAFGLPDLHLRVSELHGDVSSLAPEERMLVRGVAETRRRELATGRALARAAFADLGVASHALLPDPERVPRWPDGLVGSLAHTRHLCALALARRPRVRALGPDLEDNIGSTLVLSNRAAQSRTARSLAPVIESPLA